MSPLSQAVTSTQHTKNPHGGELTEKAVSCITPIKSCIKTCGCEEGRQTASSSGSIEQYPGIEPPSAMQSTPPPPAAPGKQEGFILCLTSSSMKWCSVERLRADQCQSPTQCLSTGEGKSSSASARGQGMPCCRCALSSHVT